MFKDKAYLIEKYWIFTDETKSEKNIACTNQTCRAGSRQIWHMNGKKDVLTLERKLHAGRALKQKMRCLM